MTEFLSDPVVRNTLTPGTIVMMMGVAVTMMMLMGRKEEKEAREKKDEKEKEKETEKEAGYTYAIEGLGTEWTALGRLSEKCVLTKTL